MKRLSLLVLCTALAAFAGPYDIDGFEAQDTGTPDDYITAEFGGELKTAPASEVGSLQSGRLVVRQKFEDPFGENETTYQLYQGRAGDLSSLTPLEVKGADYSDIVSAKIYKAKGADAEEDAEKVYFDGKYIYVPGMSSAVAYVNNAPVDLTPSQSAAPVAAAAEEDEEDSEEATPAPAEKKTASSSDDEYCDDYDPDCEDEDEYDVKGDIDRSNREADARDYSADEASENATDRFGIADEVRFWSAVALSAVAVGSAVMGVLQTMKANEAQDNYDKYSELNDKMLKGCGGNEQCEVAVSKYGKNGDWSVADMQEKMATNKKTHDSYATARNIWFGVTAASLVGSIVLFVW